MVYSLNIFSVADINSILIFTQSSLNSRIIVGLSGALLVLISFSFAQLILGRFQREKTIAFATGSGKVTISLSAVEDLIKRLSALSPELKELRPDVVAKKNGLVVVDLRVILKSGANIPELTLRLQELTKAEIQQVLGLEQEPIVNVHIAKIVYTEDKIRKKDIDKPETAAIPFGGYGRI
jgi:hypothetical protein